MEKLRYKIFLNEFSSKKWSRSEFHYSLQYTDERWSADVINIYYTHIAASRKTQSN